jgi:hypothetical protein
MAQSALTLPGMGETGTSLTVLARTGAGGSGLVRTLAEIPPGGRHARTAGVGGERRWKIGLCHACPATRQRLRAGRQPQRSAPFAVIGVIGSQRRQRPE